MIYNTRILILNIFISVAVRQLISSRVLRFRASQLITASQKSLVMGQLYKILEHVPNGEPKDPWFQIHRAVQSTIKYRIVLVNGAASALCMCQRTQLTACTKRLFKRQQLNKPAAPPLKALNEPVSMFLISCRAFVVKSGNAPY